MRKKVIILVVVLSMLSVGALIYWQTKQTARISENLSDRSKEFLKKQSKAAGSDLKNVNLEAPSGEDTRGKRIGREGCYSFVVPFKVDKTSLEDQPGSECYGRFTIDLPKASIVVYKETKVVNSWEDVSGVSSRKAKTTEYSETQKTLNGKDFLIFSLKSDLYERNAFYYTPTYYLVFNFLTKTNENLDAELESMLSSLEIN